MELKTPSELKIEGNLSEHFRKFHNQLKTLKEMKIDKKDEDIKAAILLNIIGEAAVEIYESFDLSEKQKDSYDEIIKAFEKYCSQKKNILFERRQFYSRKQEEGESFDHFLLDIKKLAKSSEFNTMENSALRDKIAFGIQDLSIQEALIKLGDPDLEKTIETCRVAERAKEQVTPVHRAEIMKDYSIKLMMNTLDPTNKGKKKAKTKAEDRLKRLAVKDSGLLQKINNLSEYELVIASHLVVPADITVSWKDIAGLDAVVEELKESVVFPIRHRDLFLNSPLWQAPKGVLLHGPPGCGKTLIAKATAKEDGMRFINLDVAMLTDKWYGESQKLASAVFTLAVKLQPCIIFIDKIDSFLRSRNSTDHEATAMMKTQFMMHWDGLSTEAGSTVIVMGATNRPQDLDKAILRRMPAQFHVGLPNAEQRLKIIQLFLNAERIDDDVDLDNLSNLTNGFSGSDLRELCRNASVYRVRESMKKHNVILEAPSTLQTTSDNNQKKGMPPPICWQDLRSSLSKMRESKMHTDVLMIDPRNVDLD